MRQLAALLWILLLAGCAAKGGVQGTPAAGADEPRIEATSLLGRPLAAPPLSDEFRKQQQALLDEARENLRANPDDPDALIWVGRRNAYLGRYAEAIELYGQGIERFPDDARFYRHRGHRYITTRRLDLAVADLERAAELIAGTPDEVEPDGLPNARNIPTSTLQSNIWYHLGLARYLRGDLEGALAAYRECLEVSKNADMLSATSHWLYMTLRRLGRDDEAGKVLAPIHAGMDIIENDDYHRLLLLYKGEHSAEQIEELLAAKDDAIGFATTGYGLANWYFYNGDEARAVALFERILTGESWAAFGHIAAEAELARMRDGG